MGDAEGEQAAQVSGAQAAAGRQNHIALPDIFADLDDILTRRDGAQDFDGVGKRQRGRFIQARARYDLGLFEHDHCICAGGNHAAGVDDSASAGRDRQAGVLPHGRLADDGQIGGEAARSAVGVGRGQRVAVHRGTGKIRQIVRGVDDGGQHAIQRRRHLDRFSGNGDRQMLTENLPGGGRRMDVVECWHDFLRSEPRFAMVVQKPGFGPKPGFWIT